MQIQHGFRYLDQASLFADTALMKNSTNLKHRTSLFGKSWCKVIKALCLENHGARSSELCVWKIMAQGHQSFVFGKSWRKVIKALCFYEILQVNLLLLTGRAEIKNAQGYD